METIKSILANEGMLQYFHAVLNKEFFGNELQPAVIRIEPPEYDEDGEETGVEACTISGYNPCLIVFYHDEDSLTSIDAGCEVYTLTVLLHEMVHQYNAQKGIQDTEETSGHMRAFFNEAKKHGLKNGYQLTEEAEKKIRSALLDVQIVLGIRDKYRRGSFQ